RLLKTQANDGDGYHLGIANLVDQFGTQSGDFGYYDPGVSNSLRDYHLGEDWNRSAGDDFGKAVYAIADGVVEFTGTITSWIDVVVIRHFLPNGAYGGFVTSLYGHLGNVSVHEGDIVHRGQEIGTIGDFPPIGSVGDHLHFEIRTAQNPDALIPYFGYSE